MSIQEKSNTPDNSSKIKVWISAMRLRTLPLAASCVLTGSAINWQNNTHSWIIFVLCLLTTLILQILSNLANDYGDHVKGTDNNQRVGPTRAMQTGILSAASMRNSLILFSFLALLSGITLLYVAFRNTNNLLYVFIFFILGLAAIAAAINYTIGKNPYGYKGLGDFFVFIFFGIVGVCGTAYLHTTEWNWLWLLPATAIGLLSSAVLNLNNLRDHINDAASRKVTLVVKLGFNRGKIYQYLLMAMAFIVLTIYLILMNSELVIYFYLLPFIILIGVARHVSKISNPADLDPLLKKVAISTFLISLLMFAANFIY